MARAVLSLPELALDLARRDLIRTARGVPGVLTGLLARLLRRRPVPRVGRGKAGPSRGRTLPAVVPALLAAALAVCPPDALPPCLSPIPGAGAALAWNGTRQDTRLACESGDGTYTSPGTLPANGVSDSRTRVNIYYPSGCAWDAAARVLVCRGADGAVTSRAASDEGELGDVEEGSGASALTSGNPFAQDAWYDGVPVGFLVAWPLATAMPGSEDGDSPATWLECDGRAVDAGDYPELHALLGGHVPDLAGAFLRGASDSETEAGALAQVTGDVLPEHTHAIPVGVVRLPAGTAADGALSVDAAMLSASLDMDVTLVLAGAADVTVLSPDGADSAATGVSGGAETRPANRAVRVYIRALP